MAFSDKIAENKKVAEKCMEMKAYNAGVTRAYYSAFLRIKSYLIAKNFDYKKFLQSRISKKGSKDKEDKEFSHGSLQAAITDCLMANGKPPADVYKLFVLGSLYEKRRRADCNDKNIIESELKESFSNLDTVLSVVT